MRRKVVIVGGGLTGVLAAFQAHDLGCRDIELHERFGVLGGVATPDQRHGAEIRHACIYFGAASDPIRGLLEQHGQAFDEFPNAYGSVSLGADGAPVATHDFGNPAIPLTGRDLTLKPKADESLAARIACYPREIAEALTRYCAWHLEGADLANVHGSAAIPLGFGRILPTGVNPNVLAAAKRADPLYDELYALTRQAGGVVQSTVASEPRGGFSALFETCRRELERLGVKVFDTSLVSPRQALLETAGDRVLVWAGNPTPLFKAVGLPTPALVKKTFATYVFRVDHAGAVPFFAHNFTGRGGIFRLYLYRSAGQTFLTAECVTERAHHELRADIFEMMRDFGGETLTLRDLVATNVAPRWIYHSMEAMAGLKTLRAELALRLGPAFVAGAWEPYAKAAKLGQVQAGLEAALADRAPLRAAG